jgi:uncharacterized protein
MKIRSITYFCDLEWPLDPQTFQKAGSFIRQARPGFEELGYEVQSTRMAGSSFTRLFPQLEQDTLIQAAQQAEKMAADQGFAYLAFGPALPDRPESYPLIPAVLAETENVFFSALMTTSEGGISLPAVRACASVIARSASISPDGFANLRFGALANIPPGGPFLPGAYHRGGPPTFALATEAADLAVEAVVQARSLAEAQENLVAAVEEHARQLVETARMIETETGVYFGGIDFTLAPFPSRELSFAEAMERLGVPAVGRHGSLAAAAFLTSSLDQARYPRAGFNGLMLPVMEDAVLAQRGAEGVLAVKDLLLYAAVCGAGLDTVPLPGDISEAALYAILLDLASLAQRLDKPLIARLMPVPGKAAGDPTGFDFAFFQNSRVLGVEAEPLHGLLAGDETLRIQPRGPAPAKL